MAFSLFMLVSSSSTPTISTQGFKNEGLTNWMCDEPSCPKNALIMHFITAEKSQGAHKEQDSRVIAMILRSQRSQCSPNCFQRHPNSVAKNSTCILQKQMCHLVQDNGQLWKVGGNKKPVGCHISVAINSTKLKVPDLVGIKHHWKFLPF